MDKNFKFSQEEKNLLQDSLSQFKNDVLKDSVARVGGTDDEAYSRSFHSKGHSRGVIIIVAE